MSSTFSQELAASPSGLNEPECELSRFAKLIRMQEPSSRSASSPSHATMTSPSENLSMAKPTSSRLDSPAKIFHSLEKVPALPESVRDSTGTSFEPFAWYDHDGRCWRTFQRCLVEGWTRFSGTWPRSGMTRSGIAFQRVPLVPLTEETASGLLPTPEASNTKAIALRSAGRSPRNFLASIPTPRPCSGLRSSGANRTEILQALKKWPTPVARDHRSPGRSRLERTGGKEEECLPQAVGGPLNPTWVEWLMGFPLGWTDLGRLATRSSRKSPKSSGEQS